MIFIKVKPGKYFTYEAVSDKNYFTYESIRVKNNLEEALLWIHFNLL